MDAVYGCNGCATTIGRAGCETHRDRPKPTPGVNLYITHCIHGLDLRLHPRCYLCRPEAAPVSPSPDVEGLTRERDALADDEQSAFESYEALRKTAQAFLDADDAYVDADFGEDEDERQASHVAKEALRAALRESGS